MLEAPIRLCCMPMGAAASAVGMAWVWLADQVVTTVLRPPTREHTSMERRAVLKIRATVHLNEDEDNIAA